MTERAPSAGGGTVVVGVDDGLLRTAVLLRAVAEARRRAGPLRVVHAHGPDGPPPVVADAAERAVAYLARVAPDMPVRRTCGGHDAGRTLALAADDDGLIVLGDRRRRLGTGAGRTVEAALADAPCPVLVVPESPHPHGRDDPAARRTVVVGVDDSEGGRAALAYALDEAVRRELTVTAVRTWDEVVDDGRATRRREPDEEHDAERAARAGLERDLVRAAEAYPSVRVHAVVAPDRPARRLVEEARGAPLLVLAHRAGVDAPAHLAAAGSTTRGVLSLAPCPVLVLGQRVVAGRDVAAASSGVVRVERVRRS